jgi:L,D-transpeptidase catalytic domain
MIPCLVNSRWPETGSWAGRSALAPRCRSLPKLPFSFVWKCRELDTALTPFVLVASLARQQLWLFARRRKGGNLRRVVASAGGPHPSWAGDCGYQLRGQFLASTARLGGGQQSGSNRTPLGLHRIAEKIGAGQPIGTVFESRRPAGFTWQGRPEAPIAHRILWLEGLEPGFNRGGNVDSHARYIYIHGLGDEPSLGRPASRGCIHLAATDLLPLFDLLPLGTLAWID